MNTIPKWKKDTARKLLCAQKHKDRNGRWETAFLPHAFEFGEEELNNPVKLARDMCTELVGEWKKLIDTMNALMECETQGDWKAPASKTSKIGPGATIEKTDGNTWTADDAEAEG